MAYLLLGLMLLVPLEQALAALTFTIDDITTFGNKKVALVTVTMDGSYPTGGEAITAANLGLKVIEFLLASSDNHGIVYSWDYSASKLMAFETGDTLDTHLQELDNTGVLSSQEVKVFAFGW